MRDNVSRADNQQERLEKIPTTTAWYFTGFVDGDISDIVKAVFSSYQSNLHFKDKVKLAIFSLGVQKSDVLHIDLYHYLYQTLKNDIFLLLWVICDARVCIYLIGKLHICYYLFVLLIYSILLVSFLIQFFLFVFLT